MYHVLNCDTISQCFNQINAVLVSLSSKTFKNPSERVSYVQVIASKQTASRTSISGIQHHRACAFNIIVKLMHSFLLVPWTYWCAWSFI